MTTPGKLTNAMTMDSALKVAEMPTDGSDMTSMTQAKTEVSNLRKLVGNLGSKLFGGGNKGGSSDSSSSESKVQSNVEYRNSYLAGWRPLQPSQVNRRLKRVSAKIKSSDLYCSKNDGGVVFDFEYAMTSFRGFYPRSPHKANQDFYFIDPEFVGKGDSDAKWKCALFGVFDGHGEHGDKCSRFVAREINATLKKAAAKRDTEAISMNLEQKKMYTQSGKSFQNLDDSEVSDCFVEAFVNIDAKMHRQKNYGAFVDDEFSGTTAVTALIRDSSVIIANVGDSRAISGKIKSDGSVVALPLSMDQTPMRRDEYLRVKAAGAEVLSVDQLDGIKDPSIQQWDEGSDDPPRCWLPGQEYPGSAFTRSIGDRIAGTIGVFAEPEMLCKTLSADDRFILIASDGIFEFLSSQEVADIVQKHDANIESGCQRACDELVKKSFQLWLQNDTRTDDITVILVRITATQLEKSATKLEKATLNEENKSSPTTKRAGRRGSIRAQTSTSLRNIIEKEQSAMRKSRRQKKKRVRDKRKSMSASMGSSLMAQGNDDNDREASISERISKASKQMKSQVQKPSATELKCIAAAMADNFLFQTLSSDIAQNLLTQFGRCEVMAGDTVIAKGGLGDRFYVAYKGKLDVLIPDGDTEKVITTYDCNGTVESVSSFGELALMYGTARTATVVAISDCVLFALERSVFRKALRKGLGSVSNTLHDLSIFKMLTIPQLDRLVSSVPALSNDVQQAELIQGTVDIDIGGGRRVSAEDLNKGLRECASVIPYKSMTELRAAQTATMQRFGKAVRTAPPLGTSNGMGRMRLSDLTFLGPAWPGDCGWQRLALHRPIGRVFTLRSMSKAELVQNGEHLDAVNEKSILQALGSYGDTTKHIAALVGSSVDDAWAHLLLDCQAMVPLGELWSSHASPSGLVLQQELQRLWLTENKSGRVPASPGIPGVCIGEAQALYYASSCVLALGQLHGFNILYRGISPQRLFLSPTGSLQLAGFRFSKHMPGRTYTLCGDTEYMSPEQIRGSGHGLSADWWALGVLIYEMITGQSPFGGDGLSDLMIYSNITRYEGPESLKWEMRPRNSDDAPLKAKCSDLCKSIVSKMLQKLPKDRMDSISAYKDPWFVESGVVWSKIAKGDASFSKDASDSNAKVPLASELSKMMKQWQHNAALPDAKSHVDSEDWFADF